MYEQIKSELKKTESAHTQEERLQPKTIASLTKAILVAEPANTPATDIPATTEVVVTSQKSCQSPNHEIYES
ncbi:hypothetical protein [Scytonema sp. PCC 10023]|uniref:hypothetical protein n=1 Tax=Scytonema sp. PCC 10023 TaxID=1680591 RepID=UPI0039C5F481